MSEIVIIICGLLLFNTTVKFILEQLNIINCQKELNPQSENIYDEETIKKSIGYTIDKHKFGQLKILFNSTL